MSGERGVYYEDNLPRQGLQFIHMGVTNFSVNVVKHGGR